MGDHTELFTGATLRQRVRGAWDRFDLDQRERFMELEPDALEQDLPPGWKLERGSVVRCPWWYRPIGEAGRFRESKAQERSVALGLHPCGPRLHTTALLAHDRKRCGQCVHHHQGGWPRTYHSCKRTTDPQRIRKKWGACEHWEAKDMLRKLNPGPEPDTAADAAGREPEERG